MLLSTKSEQPVQNVSVSEDSSILHLKDLRVDFDFGLSETKFDSHERYVEKSIQNDGP